MRGLNLSDRVRRGLKLDPQGVVEDRPGDEVDVQDHRPHHVQRDDPPLRLDRSGQELLVHVDDHDGEGRMDRNPGPVDDEPEDVGGFSPDEDQPCGAQESHHEEIKEAIRPPVGGTGLHCHRVRKHAGDAVIDRELAVEQGKDQDDAEQDITKLAEGRLENLRQDGGDLDQIGRASCRERV